MLVIGNKKYRNMQEQVAYNAEEIERINKYLDGIDLKDKLIIIDSTSGELSDDDMLIAQSPLAFISNGSTVYIKTSEDEDEILFRACDIVSTEIGNAYFNVGGSKIVVTKLTKEFALSSDAIITTYSKTQIDSIVANIMAVKAGKSELTSGLALKANVAGQAFTGAITAPSIIEDMGSDYGIELLAESVYFQTNYAGAVKNGNKLTLVLAGTFTRTAETPANIAPCYFLIPKNVADKLFSNSLGALDNKQVLFMDSTTSGVSKFARIIKASSVTPDIARLLVTFYGVNSLTIGTPYEFRYEVTFLLSDNLAS